MGIFGKVRRGGSSQRGDGYNVASEQVNSNAGEETTMIAVGNCKIKTYKGIIRMKRSFRNWECVRYNLKAGNEELWSFKQTHGLESHFPLYVSMSFIGFSVPFFFHHEGCSFPFICVCSLPIGR